MMELEAIVNIDADKRWARKRARLSNLLELMLLLLLAPIAASAALGPWQSNDQSEVRLISPWEAAPPEGELELGLHFRLAPGWHVYWKNSGDAGFPPRAELTATGLEGGSLEFPAPRRFELPGDLQSFGYEREVVYPLRARLTAPDEETITVVADLDYLVCEVDCIPYSYRLELEQRLASPPLPDPEGGALLATWRERVPEEEAGLAVLAVEGSLSPPGADPTELLLAVRGADPTPETDLFFAGHEHFDLRGPALEELDNGFRFRVPLRRRDRSRELPAAISFAWTATGLSILDGPRAVSGTISVPLDREAPTEQPGSEPAASGARSRLGAVAAGVLSYAVPAVLALFILTLLQLRGERDFARIGRIRAVSLSFAGIGIALALLALGGGLAKAAGFEAYWGFHLQQPRLVTTLALVVLLASLRLWLPRREKHPGAGASAGGALLGRGALTVLFSLVWMPPLLGEARQAGSLTALALFGVGLALPYLSLALLPRRPEAGRTAAVPGPLGRQALGFLSAATLVWLFYLLAHLVDSPRLAGIQLALLAIGLLAYYRSRTVSGARSRAMLTLLLLTACALAVWTAGASAA